MSIDAVACRCSQRRLQLHGRLLGLLLAICTALVFPASGYGDTTDIAESIHDDASRTLARWPSNVGRGFTGVFQPESLRPFLIGAAATGFATLFDDEVREEIATDGDETANFASDYLGPIGLGVLTFGLFIGGQYSEDRRFRDMSYDLSVAFVVNLGYTGILKEVVGRERPNESDDLSFPSGHASNAFALASVASAHYGKPVAIPAYGLASLIGLSRIRKDVHWLSDVVAGAALGHIVGRSVVHQNDKPLQTGLKSLRITPKLGPTSTGVMVGMNF